MISDHFRQWSQINRYGSVIDSSDQGNIYRNLMDVTIYDMSANIDIINESFTSDVKGVKVEIHYTEDLNFNAHATTIGGVDMIAVSAGTLFWVTELFSRISQTSMCLQSNAEIVDIKELSPWPNTSEINFSIDDFGPLGKLSPGAMVRV